MPPAQKKLRRSDRATTVTPERGDTVIDKLVQGEPPNGDRRWSKETLIAALDKLEGTKRTKEFILNVIDGGKSEYTSEGGIYKLHRK